MSVLPNMEDFASFFKWFVGASLALGAYFIRDIHAQYKDHLKESQARENRLVALETNASNIVARLDAISDKLDRLIERGN